MKVFDSSLAHLSVKQNEICTYKEKLYKPSFYTSSISAKLHYICQM